MHESELNPDNPLSSRGQVTQTFAHLVRSLWSFKFQYKTIQPYEFISIISQWGPQFSLGT